MNPRSAVVRRRLAHGLAAAALAAALVGCGSESSSAVVISSATAGSLAIAPAGVGPVTAGVDRAVVVERRATVTSVDVLEGSPVRLGQELLTVYTIGDTGAVATATNRLRADEKELQSVRARDGIGAATTIALLDQVARDRQALSDLKSSPTVVRAPADGRISGLAVKVGAELTRTDVVLHVVDAQKLRVTVPVAAAYRRLITVGQRGTLSLPGGSGASFESTVVSVGSSTSEAGTDAAPTSTGSVQPDTVPITVELPNPAAAIPLGSAAYVRFPMNHLAPVTVNSLAVLGADRQPFVFVVDDGRVQQRAVVTGVSDGSSTEILSGLKVGDEVVISGGRQLTDGAAVHASESELS